MRKYNELNKEKSGAKSLQPLKLAAVFFAMIAGTFFIENTNKKEGEYLNSKKGQ